MKRLITCFLAPLIVMMLMSFTSNYKVGADTITANKSQTRQQVDVKFSPAKIVVDDNRSLEWINVAVEKNTQSNFAVASAINNRRLSDSLELRERRCESLVDRITRQSGLTEKEVKRYFASKRACSLVGYSALFGYLMFFFFRLLSMNKLIVSSKAYLIEVSVYLITFLVILSLYLITQGIVLAANHAEIINNLINSPPG